MKFYVASGSGNTHAGLLFGLRAIGMPVKVFGVCVRRESNLQWERIRVRCHEIANLLQVKSSVEDDDIIVSDDHFFPGYGEANSAVWEWDNSRRTRRSVDFGPHLFREVNGCLTEACQIRRCAYGTCCSFIQAGTPGIYGYQDQFERALFEHSIEQLCKQILSRQYSIFRRGKRLDCVLGILFDYPIHAW